SLRHENIVPIYEVVSKKTEHFLVMEFIEGRDLRQFVKVRKKIEPLEAVRLMSEITSGLKYAFERALTHRDLKISNVLVSSRGTAKLVDFGLASIDVSLNDSSAIPGAAAANCRTVDYAALERATGVRRDDSRSDIYFLGCIFYHMLTGRSALKETKDRVQRLAKTRFLEVVPVQKADPSIPHCVSIVLNKALMLDPERRYQTPSAMLSDLRIATRRLQGDDQDAQTNGNSAEAVNSTVTENQLSVMVVESNGEMQNVFRNGFKRAGYRVLITSNPQLVFARFQQEPGTTDCIIFNAQEVGQPALEVFNRFAESESTRNIPALLLLDETQAKWKSQARMAPHRGVLLMPLTMRKLRAAVVLVTSQQTAATQAGAANNATAADG
ncbi:MAG: protein kinase, partial [Planctomycetota bacterium]|nr:protein kinase [Planctomycetota bacterium]